MSTVQSLFVGAGIGWVLCGAAVWWFVLRPIFAQPALRLEIRVAGRSMWSIDIDELHSTIRFMGAKRCAWRASEIGEISEFIVTELPK